MILSEEFLAPYHVKGDNFPNLLARSTYLGKYCRDGETWVDTVRRVVEGNCSLDSNVTQTEAESLYDIIWRGWALPPGRGLWTGGVPNIPVDSLYNCHYTTIRSIDDWCWTADMLMCGGGVGVGLLEIDKLPPVTAGTARLRILCSKSHPNVGEVTPDDPTHVTSYTLVDDSRQGWVEALRQVLQCAWAGISLTLNVSPIRPRGAPIKTFGGVACGPGPLVQLLRNAWAVVIGAQGRQLTSVECLDITNHVGMCIKSGNLRRSALIQLGNASDQPFRDAKKDFSAVLSHRMTSNNSVTLVSEGQIDNFDWPALVEDASLYGEPGIVNLWLARQTDPGAMGTNPCAEAILEDYEACCLSEVFPARFPVELRNHVLSLITRYTLRQRLQPMLYPRADEVRKRNMRIGVGLGGLCDFEFDGPALASMYLAVRSEADSYADALQVSRPIAVTVVKPSGTISLLNGSSPGVHAPYAPFYVRRTRISKQEPMAAALTAAGVPSEPCVYDSTGNTLVFSFPMKATATDYVTTETVKTQVERQVMVQSYWADQAVSTTISFKEHEKEELAELLKKHAKDMKSISCLPSKHGYAQPPYEEITEEKFHEMSALIDQSHPLTVGGELEIEECAGGVCPVK